MRRGVAVGAIVVALVLAGCDDDGPSVGLPTTVAVANDPTVPRPPLMNADGSNEAFSGVGQLTGYGSTSPRSCSMPAPAMARRTR